MDDECQPQGSPEGLVQCGCCLYVASGTTEICFYRNGLMQILAGEERFADGIRGYRGVLVAHHEGDPVTWQGVIVLSRLGHDRHYGNLDESNGDDGASLRRYKVSMVEQ